MLQITFLKERESNEEWNRCLDSNSLILGRCIYGCGENEDCKDQCVTEFEDRQLNCPCEVSIESEKLKFKIALYIFSQTVPVAVLAKISIALKPPLLLMLRRQLKQRLPLPLHRMRILYWS